MKGQAGKSFERCYETFNVCDLKPGDHIVQECLGLLTTFWHHMILESVNDEEINVIHYYHDFQPVWKWPSVCRTSLKFTPDRFYRIVYEESECLPADEVLKRAQAKLGEKDFGMFTNNCEHFANECKTGEKKCYQIKTSIETLGKNAIGSITSFFRRGKQWFEMMLRSENSWLRQPGVTEVVEYGTRIGAGLAIFVTFVIELVLLGHDCKEAKTKLDEGELTREEYCEVIVKRVCGVLCSIPGFAVGFIVGGMILPVLGAFIGGAVGDYLGKEAGEKLGELLAPLFIKHLAEVEKAE